MNWGNFTYIAYGFMGAVFGTVFLMEYLKFQKLIDKITQMGEETYGKIISIELERGTGRYQSYHNAVRIVFEANGETVVPPKFTVSRYSSFYVGQELYVQYYRYNPEECLIKERPESNWYLNRWSYFGGILGIVFAAIFYLIALGALIALLV